MEFDFRSLATVNAILNATSATLLMLGFVAIRSRRVTLHRALMSAAFVASTLFLLSYLVYHAKVGSVGFQGQGPVRTFYFGVLLTHTVLAAFVPFLAIGTLALAIKGRFEKHRRLARWTLPIWLYVSVTGVVIYWMVYRMAW